MSGTRIDHLGVAVRSLEEAVEFYERVLGVSVEGREEVPQERVRVAMVPAGESRIELLEATSDDSPIARFIAKRGEGLHHVALRVPDLEAAVERLRAAGARLVTDRIQAGAGGQRYVFVHPSSAKGVLLELVEESA
jgi:methylmalonyl-CoA epimerase